MNQESLLLWPEVNQCIELYSSKVYQLIEQGAFQKQVGLSRRAIAWKESDIAKWTEGLTQANKEEGSYEA